MASLPLSSPRPQAPMPATVKPAAMVGTRAPAARLSALEWSIVAMAERDGLATIREPGRYTRALRRLFGLKTPNRLANGRLETLRRIAILAWHFHWNVPPSELAGFIEAGYSTEQFELIQESIGKARAAHRRRTVR